jgi:hypothetical protein
MSDFDDRSRRLARERYWQHHSKAKYECPDCGRGREEVVGEFQVHHKSGNPYDNRIEKLVALCGFCHRLREDKKPSLKRIKKFRDQGKKVSETGAEPEPEIGQDDTPVIYTAGRMEWHNGEDSSYRTCIEEPQHPDIDATFIHPHETHFDHGGDVIDGCVAEDMEMIDNADRLVAFFDRTDQTGTVVETVHAANQGMDTLILLSTDVYDISKNVQNFPNDIGPMAMRGLTPLWFLINYLKGDGLVNKGSPTPQRITRGPSMPAKFVWEGFNSTIMVVQRGNNSIQDAIAAWVRDDIGSHIGRSDDEVIADE